MSRKVYQAVPWPGTHRSNIYIMKTVPIRVLIINDKLSDVREMLEILQGAGFEVKWECVDSEKEYQPRLSAGWDLIISRDILPQFDALHALNLLQHRNMVIPFVVVADDINAETAAECMQSGVTDFVSRDRLARLGEIARELFGEAKAPAGVPSSGVNESAEPTAAALPDRDHLLRSIYDNVKEAIWVAEAQDDGGFRYISMNRAGGTISGIPAKEWIGRRPEEFLPPEVADAFNSNYDKCLRLGRSITFEEKQRIGESKILAMTTLIPMRDESSGSTRVLGMAVDISQRKLAEDNLRKSRDKLRELSEHLQTVREAEATRIAKRIHDDLGQVLTALNLDVAWLKRRIPEDQAPLLEKAEAMRRLIDSAIATVQSVSKELLPNVLDDMDLVEAIRWYVEDFETRTEIDCALALETEDLVFDAESTKAILRILKESMTNIARHARASKVGVSLLVSGDDIILEVSDNGKGILTEDAAHPGAFGLIQMKESAEYLDGEFTIEGKPGRGTTVRVVVPCSKHTHPPQRETAQQSSEEAQQRGEREVGH